MVYEFAKKLEKDRTIHGKPVKVIYVRRITQLSDYNIVYIDESKNEYFLLCVNYSCLFYIFYH